MIKIYILTYNRPQYLHENLKSLFESDANPDDYHVTIINNMELVFELAPEFQERVTVYHNKLRPDWSNGHVARDWNGALTQGFGNLEKPINEQVILVQDDCIWDTDWKVRLDKIHETYDLYAADWGDAFVSYLPEVVRKVGLYDERFTSVGCQEADYFLRAYLHHRDKSSINDYRHRRAFNTTELVAHRNRTKHDELPVHFAPYGVSEYWKDKWGSVMPTSWDKMADGWDNNLKPNFDELNFYPWFSPNKKRESSDSP